MSKKIYYGCGFNNASRKYGKFEVRFSKGIYVFYTLSTAKEFYEKLSMPKALWDITEVPELIIAEHIEKQSIT